MYNSNMEFDGLLKLYNAPLDELLAHSRALMGDEVEFCSLINAKSGRCSENCRYCAQSSHYKTSAIVHPLVSTEEVIEAALEAKKNGAIRFAIVASGKGPADEDLDKMCEMIEAINVIGLKSCASLGILNEKQVEKLRVAGLSRYHHNINTSRSYYPSINTTHSFDDRVNTCKLIKDAGIELCCGVIVGMGETVEQRVEMALELAEIAPDSIPFNILIPIEGTPFENYHDKIDEEHILRTLAIFKIANPESIVRLCGGRAQRMSEETQKIAFKNAVEGAMIGNMLTVEGGELWENERVKAEHLCPDLRVSAPKDRRSYV